MIAHLRGGEEDDWRLFDGTFQLSHKLWSIDYFLFVVCRLFLKSSAHMLLKNSRKLINEKLKNFETNSQLINASLNNPILHRLSIFADHLAIEQQLLLRCGTFADRKKFSIEKVKEEEEEK